MVVYIYILNIFIYIYIYIYIYITICIHTYIYIYIYGRIAEEAIGSRCGVGKLLSRGDLLRTYLLRMRMHATASLSATPTAYGSIRQLARDSLSISNTYLLRMHATACFVCSRMLTYAAVCSRMLTYAVGVCKCAVGKD
jgi:hypothetical protein